MTPLPEVVEDVLYEHVEAAPPEMEPEESLPTLPASSEAQGAPSKTSSQALEEAVEKLPPAVRAGVLEALKGRFVGLIPAMKNQEVVAMADEAAPLELSD